jgi:signal transduction histidine kinase
MKITPLRASPLVMSIVVAGVVLSALSVITVRNRLNAFQDEWMNERAEIVSSAIQATVGDLAAGLEGAGAFMEVSAPVSQESFAAYVSRIDPRLSLIGVAYLPVIPAAELEAFEARMRLENMDHPQYRDYRVQELSVTGEAAPDLAARDTYFPVQMFVDGEFLKLAVPVEDGESTFDLGLGIDGGSRPEWRQSLTDAVARDDVVVSDFIDVAFADVAIGKAFVIAVPVRSAVEDSSISGLLAAPMIDFLLPTELDVSITSDVNWQVGSVGDGIEGPGSRAWVGAIEVPGGSWSLRVEPTEAGAADLAGTPLWLVTLVGLALTALAAVIGHLVVQRARSRASLDEMQRLSEEKDRFLASVSHEIRTPLTSVSGLAHELRDRPQDFGVEEVKDLIGLIADESDELSAIVEDLLVAARTDIDKVNIHAGRLIVGKEAENAMETSGVSAALVGARSAEAWGDAQRVRQILRNLLTNAGRYGGDTIEIRMADNSHWARITVADNGAPIPDLKRREIFEPYVTAHREDHKAGSIGLGLFISRKLATLMGGSLDYHHDGEWSMFSLDLPMVAPSGDGPMVDPAPHLLAS